MATSDQPDETSKPESQEKPAAKVQLPTSRGGGIGGSLRNRRTRSERSNLPSPAGASGGLPRPGLARGLPGRATAKSLRSSHNSSGGQDTPADTARGATEPQEHNQVSGSASSMPLTDSPSPQIVEPDYPGLPTAPVSMVGVSPLQPTSRDGSRRPPVADPDTGTDMTIDPNRVDFGLGTSSAEALPMTVEYSEVEATETVEFDAATSISQAHTPAPSDTALTDADLAQSPDFPSPGPSRNLHEATAQDFSASGYELSEVAETPESADVTSHGAVSGAATQVPTSNDADTPVEVATTHLTESTEFVNSVPTLDHTIPGVPNTDADEDRTELITQWPATVDPHQISPAPPRGSQRQPQLTQADHGTQQELVPGLDETLESAESGSEVCDRRAAPPTLAHCDTVVSPSIDTGNSEPLDDSSGYSDDDATEVLPPASPPADPATTPTPVNSGNSSAGQISPTDMLPPPPGQNPVSFPSAAPPAPDSVVPGLTARPKPGDEPAPLLPPGQLIQPIRPANPVAPHSTELPHVAGESLADTPYPGSAQPGQGTTVSVHSPAPSTQPPSTGFAPEDQPPALNPTQNTQHLPPPTAAAPVDLDAPALLQPGHEPLAPKPISQGPPATKTPGLKTPDASPPNPAIESTHDQPDATHVQAPTPVDDVHFGRDQAVTEPQANADVAGSDSSVHVESIAPVTAAAAAPASEMSSSSAGPGDSSDVVSSAGLRPLPEPTSSHQQVEAPYPPAPAREASAGRSATPPADEPLASVAQGRANDVAPRQPASASTVADLPATAVEPVQAVQPVRVAARAHAPRVPAGQVVVEMHAVKARYGRDKALEQASMRAITGETIAVIGPRGAGKTTLLGCCSGRVNIASGKFYVDGKLCKNDVHEALRAAKVVQMCIQQVTNRSQTVRQYLATNPNAELASQAVEDIVFDRFPHLRPHSERQMGQLTMVDHRILDLAATLTKDPRIVIIDDIAEGLDRAGVDTLSAICREVTSMGPGLVISNREPHAALDIASRVTVVQDRKTVKHGASEEIRQILLGKGILRPN